MTHVVKDYTNVIGASFPQVDAALKASGASSIVGAQTNGAWLQPGSLTTYGNVPAGQLGVTYLLEGRDVYISLTYEVKSQKVTRCVQFAAAKNWVQRVGGVAELAAGKLLDYYTGGATSKYTKGIERKGTSTAIYASKNGTVAALDPSDSVAATGAGSTSSSDQVARAILGTVVADLSQPASSAANASQASAHGPSLIVLAGLLIAVALIVKKA